MRNLNYLIPMLVGAGFGGSLALMFFMAFGERAGITDHVGVALAIMSGMMLVGIALGALGGLLLGRLISSVGPRNAPQDDKKP